MSQPKHSKIGASSSERWMNCAGSVMLSAKAPEQESSFAADEGTAAHALGERCLNEGTNASEYVGETLGDFVIDQEMASAVDTYVNYVRARHQEEGGVLGVETRFDLSSLYPGLYGTNDACIVRRGRKLIVIDFKYGFSPVEATDNKQLLYYGVGAAQSCDFDFVDIELVIVQPRAPHVNGPIRRWTVSKKYLVEWSFVLIQAVRQTERVDAPLKRGPWCEYCPAKGICPKINEVVEDAVGLTVLDGGPVAIESLSDLQIAKIIENKKLIEDFIDKVQTYALHKMKSGEKIEGLKLVSGRSRRDWIDEDKVVEVFGDAAFERKVMTVAKAEKAFGKNLLAGMYVDIAGSETVAHVSDRRKEVQSLGGKLILNKEKKDA